MTNQIQKTCALSSCDKPFEGKSSKKFCSNSCRRRGHHDKKLTLAKTSNQPKEYSHANARRSEEIVDS